MSTDRPRALFAPEQLPPELEPWEQAAEGDRRYATVVFNLPVDQVFHYLVPDRLRGFVQPGQRVKVPFGRGNQLATGYCVAIDQPPETSRRIKPVQEVVDAAPLISGHLLELTRWIAEEYLCTWGQVLESVIPAGVKKRSGTREITVVSAAPDAAARRTSFELTAKQTTLLDYILSAPEPVPADEALKAAKCGSAPLNALRKLGLVLATKRRAGQFHPPVAPLPNEVDLELNPEQARGLGQILAAVRAQEHRTLLLHGVTGSGKTEVYIQAIREVVSYGRQAIVLVPEISLTPQTIRRFQSRFPSVAVLHSHLGDAERHWHWQQIAEGRVQVVVGARSAVFAPAPNLGLIVIDEEHETSFKQDSTPRYHAREVARRRAELLKIPLVLGSATPTLESWHRAQTGQDALVSLPRRVAGLPLPPVVIVDIRNDPHCSAGASLGRVLRTAMQSALEEQGQVILFLNLRGYSPVLWCRGCGSGVKCPACDITLTWHRDKGEAICHSCDYRTIPPTHCPSCNQPGLRYLGTGTQRLEQEVKARFPGRSCLRMDSDTMSRPGSHDRALEQFRSGAVEILLGTQMIAKGLDFPNVTLVGVVDADTVLHQPDLRASERTFQLIAQVAGRTGRSARGGRVYVQSSAPGEQAILLAAAHDFPKFAAMEMEHRREQQAPPFQRLTRIILRGADERKVHETAREMAGVLKTEADKLRSPVRILGPAPAPIAKLKNLFRYHFQLTAPQLDDIRRLWHTASAKLPKPADIEYVVDVDPMNMR